MTYDAEHTWEYNMLQAVRWGTADEKDDIVHFIRTHLSKIVEEEGVNPAERMHSIGTVKLAFEAFRYRPFPHNHPTWEEWVKEHLKTKT